MTVKFMCLKCSQETDADLQYDSTLDCQVFNCQHCGAKHLDFSASRAPGGPLEIQFRLDED